MIEVIRDASGPADTSTSSSAPCRTGKPLRPGISSGVLGFRPSAGILSSCQLQEGALFRPNAATRSVMFRPRGFSPPRRFAPRRRCGHYCSPQPAGVHHPPPPPPDESVAFGRWWRTPGIIDSSRSRVVRSRASRHEPRARHWRAVPSFPRYRSASGRSMGALLQEPERWSLRTQLPHPEGRFHRVFPNLRTGGARIRAAPNTASTSI